MDDEDAAWLAAEEEFDIEAWLEDELEAAGVIPGGDIPAPEAPVEPVEAVVENIEGVAHSLGMKMSNKSWGVFRFTAIPPGRRAKFGAYQASCPFHKLNAKTGCVKTNNFVGPTYNDRKQSLTQLMYWCGRAREFNRQWKHRTCDIVMVPPLADIRKMIIEVRPVGVKTDDVLDAEEYADSED